MHATKAYGSVAVYFYVFVKSALHAGTFCWTVVLVQFTNNHTEFSIQNLLQTIEELQANEVQIAGKGQQHHVGYALVDRLDELRQVGVVLARLLPELLG
jgi:hypothetical protein